MILELRIGNLILIETAEVYFKPHLNVLSGETGSGKSAIMEALQLIVGGRADTSIIRRGATKGSVEALIHPKYSRELKELLDAFDIEYSPEDSLLIRREIQSTGKSRALINDQVVTATQLKQVGDLLIDIVGQHANQGLLSTDYHRRLLDAFANLEEQSSYFQKEWQKENNLRKTLEDLVMGESARLRDIERCSFELEEIENAHIKEGEEECLFAEYTHLSNAEERSSKTREVMNGIVGEKNAVLPILRRQKGFLEQLQTLDPAIEEIVKLHQNAFLELEEVGHLLTQYHSRIEHNPSRLKPLDERLRLINSLKKKYGKSVADILGYANQLKQKLQHLQNTDHQIEAIKEDLAKIESQNDQLAAGLTCKRQAAIPLMEKALQKELASLNMPKAIFQVELSPQKRSASGDEKIEFFLIPNTGEHRIPIRECASGGELSRLMLALQTLLAGKAATPTLVFDEIDANIGGATAVIVGEKLKCIARQHQVLCITHFPQVASQADHHIQIAKTERDGRTHTQVTILDEHSRRMELKRMRGEPT